MVQHCDDDYPKARVHRIALAVSNREFILSQIGGMRGLRNCATNGVARN